MFNVIELEDEVQEFEPSQDTGMRQIPTSIMISKPHLSEDCLVNERTSVGGSAHGSGGSGGGSGGHV